MKISDIENIELKYLSIEDYQELKDVMISAYQSMPEAYWHEKHIRALINKFPEGQVVIKINGHLAGSALSIIVDYDHFTDNHTYKEITADYTFNSHDRNGDILYGIDVFIKPEY
ncbi:MAG: carbon-nitrogen hydrolase, partial [Prolixibacteraceae bacterium]|nr:carbon-nitrogen hydrolase [Prolixibacteraceae bacterium]